MRAIILLVILLACTNSNSETIQKWTDENGQVHYGDSPPTKTAKTLKQLEIEDSFDPVAYEQALNRQSLLEAEIKKIDARERKELKAAEKRLEDYFKDLDEKERKLEQKKASKRKSRESQRNRSSIKLKPNKQAKKYNDPSRSFRR